MRKTQILLHLILMLLAFQPHFAISSTFQETKSATNFKINTAAYNSRIISGKNWKTLRNTMDAEKKVVPKTPSGPNPIGNHRPPSRK
ncbi:hypothetical protein ACJIZ3_012571 [Penstemon smallii]|uniref:Uncharacterized protein n=1 Tax=Penstemon smallii TaxID=265156 RepID=A0ABD3UMG3_9LAMI